MRFAASIFLLMAILATCTTAGESDPVSDIDGTWVIDSFLFNGEPVPKEILDNLKKRPYVIKDGEYIIGDGGTVVHLDTLPLIRQGLTRVPSAIGSNGITITFDRTKTPGVVTATNPAMDGWHGIFKIDNGKLLVCRCSADLPIPTDFKSSIQNGWQLRTYIRERKADTKKPD